MMTLNFASLIGTVKVGSYIKSVTADGTEAASFILQNYFDGKKTIVRINMYGDIIKEALIEDGAHVLVKGIFVNRVTKHDFLLTEVKASFVKVLDNSKKFGATASQSPRHTGED
jgi:hypothetical protein